MGARSALFVLWYQLGLIIIDEEHESTYKQESAPRYHARDVAAWMAQRTGAALVLGSATPSIETLCRCKVDDMWHRVVLPTRANGAYAEVRIIDMAKGFRPRLSFHVRQRAAGKPVRRGRCGPQSRAHAQSTRIRELLAVSRLRLCARMHYVLGFADLSRSGPKLVCHHCGKTSQAPVSCPVCGSPYLKKFGAGTQRVEMELRRILDEHASATGRPLPRVVRMDSDTTATRDAHEKLLAEFGQPGAAVLLGTQMIAKGLDFDDVVLVGVINADTQLRLPDFRSAERTFDGEQVAGRAGRGHFEGRVLVQTYMHDAMAILAAAHYDRKRFLADELPKRKMLGYPPYARLANILVWGAEEEAVRAEAEALAKRRCKTDRRYRGRRLAELGCGAVRHRQAAQPAPLAHLIKAPAGPTSQGSPSQ